MADKEIISLKLEVEEINEEQGINYKKTLNVEENEVVGDDKKDINYELYEISVKNCDSDKTEYDCSTSINAKNATINLGVNYIVEQNVAISKENDEKSEKLVTSCDNNIINTNVDNLNKLPVIQCTNEVKITILCELCGMPFDQLSDLKVHQTTHIINNVLRCNKCYKIFTTNNEFEQHLTGNGICLICGLDLKYPCILKQHTCSMGMSASTSTSMITPFSLFNQQLKLNCTECGVQFDKENEYETHMNRVREMDDILRCPKCFEFFNNTKDAHLHLIGSGFCTKCGQDLQLPCMLREHVCHSGFIPSLFTKATNGVISMVTIKCKVCDEKFLKQEDYVLHTREKHNVNVDQLHCKECNVIFKEINDLKLHQENFHNQNIYRCNHCFKTFKAKHLLSVHIQGISVCLLCGEDVRSPCMLIRHVCNEISLKQRQQLISKNQLLDNTNTIELNDEHKLLSIDISQFSVTKCNFCKQNFQHYEAYLKHIRRDHCINTNKLLCNLCGNVFNKPNSLKMHQKLVHQMKGVLRCPQCHRAFRSRDHVIAHLNIKEKCKKCLKEFPSDCERLSHICVAIQHQQHLRPTNSSHSQQ